jgi:hypothetical protein
MAVAATVRPGQPGGLGGCPPRRRPAGLVAARPVSGGWRAGGVRERPMPTTRIDARPRSSSPSPTRRRPPDPADEPPAPPLTPRDAALCAAAGVDTPRDLLVRF